MEDEDSVWYEVLVSIVVIGVASVLAVLLRRRSRRRKTVPEDEPIQEPEWCVWCEDRPVRGRLVVVDENGVVLRPDSKGVPICSYCGPKANGAPSPGSCGVKTRFKYVASS